ncbi:MAG: acyl-CoA desaturase [Phycisphaerales bacterium]|nr:acyl-CoA desaturase [Phycisphaerae bacterium]NNF41690.1 acyl-CoA desaturase [Phycisphaerales bacterium]NNM26174.1 acyl-CoA desaturase [Phycisphaerales bacterium]
MKLVPVTLRRWFVNDLAETRVGERPDRIDWGRCVPFVIMHLGCLGVIFVGWSWAAVGLALGLYVVRMFAITGFYHRYFSHRTFKTSRWFQFVMATAGSAAVQRGPLWWAAHHRHHHNHSDEDPDHHSPGLRGFWMSHMGWFMTPAGYASNPKYVRDWMRYPELRFLDRYDWIVPVILAAGVFGLGALASAVAPGLGLDGWQTLVWGFFISTVLVYHGTYTINSVAHAWGRRRFDTGDDSRNNFWLALITLGEGWHNNHHHYPASTRQGFYWWEIDLTYYALRFLAVTGLIWDLRPVPKRVLEEGRAT